MGAKQGFALRLCKTIFATSLAVIASINKKPYFRTMREVLVKVPDEQYRFLMKLLQNLSFVEAKPVKLPKPRRLTPAQQEWVDDMREALQQVEQHQRGEIKLRSLDELINEL